MVMTGGAILSPGLSESSFEQLLSQSTQLSRISRSLGQGCIPRGYLHIIPGFLREFQTAIPLTVGYSLCFLGKSGELKKTPSHFPV